MKLTFYGHSSVQLEIGDKTILFDPFISPNPQAKSIDINSLKPNYILVSHGHGDHVADVATIQKTAALKL